MRMDPGLSEPIALVEVGIKEGVALMLCAGKLSSVVPQFRAARRMKNKVVCSAITEADKRTATQQRVGADT